MICESAAYSVFKSYLFLGKQIGDNFRMVINFILAIKVGVIFFQGIIAVRTGCNNLFDSVTIHQRDVGLR